MPNNTTHNTKHNTTTILTLILLLLYPTTNKAQTTQNNTLPLVPIEQKYPFINYTDNTLQFPGQHTDFDTLYNKLDTLLNHTTTNINIIHIGGSHVQAGVFDHRMRTNFANLNDTIMAGRGMIFPYSVMNTKGPANYTFTHQGTWQSTRLLNPTQTDTLGLSGATITTTDSLARLTMDIAPYTFNTLHILADATNNNTYPYALHDTDTLRPTHQPDLHSYTINFPTQTTTADIRFNIPPTKQITLRGIIPQTHKQGLTYTAAGINGADVAAWLRCKHIPTDLNTIKPDLVILAIGVNDANVPPKNFNPQQFKERYRQLITLFKQANPHCALLFVTNNDCLLNLGRKTTRRFNPNTAVAAQAMKELAAEYGGALWDQYQIMGGAHSSLKWKNKKLMRTDRIHFTAAGYQLLGDLLFNAIITDYNTHTTNNTHNQTQQQ